jgi:hypothetical protein
MHHTKKPASTAVATANHLNLATTIINRNFPSINAPLSQRKLFISQRQQLKEVDLAMKSANSINT